MKQNNSEGNTPGEGGGGRGEEDVFGYFFALKGKTELGSGGLFVGRCRA